MSLGRSAQQREDGKSWRSPGVWNFQIKLVGANLLASLAASSIGSVVTLIVTPLYLHFLGVEAFGLVGFYLTLAFLGPFVDLGLGIALSRELALLSSGASISEVRSFAKMCQFCYWLLSSIAGAALVLLAGLVARNWLSSDTLSVSVVTEAVRWMGVALALQLPRNLYIASLKALQRQVATSAVGLGTGLFRPALSVSALSLWSADIVTFFIAQVIAIAVETIILGRLMWHVTPRAEEPERLSLALLWERRHFIGGVASGQMASALIAYADRLVISAMLPLRDLGYYVLATSLAAVASRGATAWLDAIFPRTVQLVSAGRWDAVGRLYHLSTQVLTVLVAPISAVLIIQARDVLLLWTRNGDVAANAARPLVVLVLATASGAAIVQAQNLQLASGWSKLISVSRAVALVLFPPVLFASIKFFGLTGAALPFLGLQLTELMILVGIMHRYLLRGELMRWYFRDILVPSCAALGAAWGVRLVMPAAATGAGLVLWLALSGCTATAAAALCCPDLRVRTIEMWRHYRTRAYAG